MLPPRWPLYRLSQGSPHPGLWTSTGSRPVRNRATHQEVSGGPGKLHLLPRIAPHRLHYCLNRPLPRSVEKLSSTKPVLGAKKSGDRGTKLRANRGCVCVFHLQAAAASRVPVPSKLLNEHLWSSPPPPLLLPPHPFLLVLLLYMAHLQ